MGFDPFSIAVIVIAVLSVAYNYHENQKAQARYNRQKREAEARADAAKGIQINSEAVAKTVYLVYGRQLVGCNKVWFRVRGSWGNYTLETRKDTIGWYPYVKGTDTLTLGGAAPYLGGTQWPYSWGKRGATLWEAENRWVWLPITAEHSIVSPEYFKVPVNRPKPPNSKMVGLFAYYVGVPLSKITQVTYDDDGEAFTVAIQHWDLWLGGRSNLYCAYEFFHNMEIDGTDSFIGERYSGNADDLQLDYGPVRVPPPWPKYRAYRHNSYNPSSLYCQIPILNN